MKHPNYLRLFLLLLFSSLLFISCKKDKQESFLKRNLEELNFNYTEEHKEFTIRASGEWSIDIPTDNSWITVEPASGVGDGQTYQKVVVTCKRNTDEARSGALYLNGSGQSNVAIKINQSNGLFEWTRHTNGSYLALDGQIIVGQPVTAKIKIPYAKAVGNESFPLTASLSGKGASGLALTSNTATITEEGDGYLYISLSGTATVQGELNINVNLNETDFGTIQTLSSNGVTLVNQDFKNFLWGGDCIGNKVGITTTTTATASFSLTDATTACDIGTNGANGVGVTSTIRSGNAAFYKAIGMENWLGVRNYMRPGYIQLGAASTTSTEFGSLISPELAIPTGQSKDILVTFKAAKYIDPAPSSILVGLYPKNTSGVTVSTLSSVTAKANISLATKAQTWATYTCIIKNANNASSLVIMLPEDTNQGGTVQASRVYIDDISVIY